MMISRISIRKKIIYSFGGLLLLISATSLISYGIVHQVENKILLVEVIDDFLNLTLELRRYEKNYFLDQHEEDYRNCLIYIDKIDDSLATHLDRFSTFLPTVKDFDIRNILRKYKENMMRLREENRLLSAAEHETNGKILLQNQIRDAGQKLTKIAEIIAHNERKAIKRLLKTSRTMPIVSTIILFFLALVIAMPLGKKIVSSLKLLEDYTSQVAQGGPLAPPKTWVEEEIHSLFRAFRRMNHELRRRQRHIVQTEKLASLGTLLAGVAHELNNPLSNISTSVQIIAEEMDEPDPEFHKNLITQIGEQTDKARDIVRTLLEFSRVKEFKKEKLQFHSIMEDTLKLVRTEIPSEVELHVEYDPEIDLFADKQRMQQVFINLIKNSADALGHNGNIWINARTIYTKTRKRMVEIIVEDDGPGIDPKDLSNIFDPFFTTKEVGRGSGLGLSIVHEIIDLHDGEIRVDSRLGMGTSFIIWLPVNGE